MSNRELDERVARAMGWKFNPEGDEDGYRWASNHPNPYRAHAPVRYSSDWSCCEEMLAWLRGLGHNTFIKQFKADGEYHVDAESWWPACDPRMARTSGRCATLPEALARLVVAVAGAKEKKQ